MMAASGSIKLTMFLFSFVVLLLLVGGSIGDEQAAREVVEIHHAFVVVCSILHFVSFFITFTGEGARRIHEASTPLRLLPHG